MNFFFNKQYYMGNYTGEWIFQLTTATGSVALIIDPNKLAETKVHS